MVRIRRLLVVAGTAVQAFYGGALTDPSLGTTALSQGVSFWLAGSEMLLGLHAPPARRPALDPDTQQILSAEKRAEELLEIRRSSPLFRLGSARLIEQKLSFPSGGPAQTPGVIVMRIDDTVGPDTDPTRKGLVVVFNASDRATTQQVPGTARAGYRLHPVQATGSDPVVRTASYDGSTGRFTVPPRTVAVFQR